MSNTLKKCLFYLYTLVSISIIHSGVSVESQSYSSISPSQSVRKCERIEKPANGKYIDLFNTPLEEKTLPPNTVLWYTCDEEYELFPKNTLLICLKDGSWSQEPPICTGILVDSYGVSVESRSQHLGPRSQSEGLCQRLQKPANGKYVDLFNTSLTQQTLPLNTILWYSCEEEYHLSQKNVLLICLEDGGWSQEPPTCSLRCSLPIDRGTCRNFQGKWYFDIKYGGCSKFWYGGCDGNENRFNTEEECESICVKPVGTNICSLPKVSGPCLSNSKVWYYDVDLNDCEQFDYGGCFGNHNRFHTRLACMELCFRNITAGEDATSTGESPGWRTVTTTYLPDTPSHVQEFSAVSGTIAELLCRIPDRDESNIQIKWSRKGLPLPPQAYESDGVLHIDNVQPAAQGEYSCVGVEASGRQIFNEKMYLTIISPPRITINPPRQAIHLGEDVSINCSATGEKPIQISWSPLNRKMPTSVYTRDGYIRFNNIKLEDSGKYICNAQNIFGSASSVTDIFIEDSFSMKNRIGAT